MESRFLKHLLSTLNLASAHEAKLRKLAKHNHTPIGGIAMTYGLLSPAQTDKVLDRQKEQGGKFGELAVDLGLLSEADVKRLLDIQAFRGAISLVEAAVLAGIIDVDRATRLLASFFDKSTSPARALASGSRA